MKKTLFVLLAASIFTSCMQPLEEKSTTQIYRVKGTLNGDFGDYIRIRYKSQLDSVEIINNTFSLEGEVASPTAFQFVFDSLTTSDTYYLENDTLLFDMVSNEVELEDEVVKTYEVSQLAGGKTSKIKADFESFINSTPKSKLNRTVITDKVDSLIKTNPNHDYLGKIILKLIINQDLLYNDSRGLLSQLDLDELNPEDVKLLEAYQQKRQNFQIGSKIPNYDLLSITSQTVELKTKFDKYNLLVFWNSWCDQCKEEQQQQIKTVYENFKFKGFEVISISVDTNQQDWLESVAEMSMPWTSLRVQSGFTGAMASEMGIVDLPQYYLVDQSGRIIEINLSPDELQTILYNLLN